MINLPRATGREGGCPPRGDISDSVVLTVKNGGGGTFGRKCPALGEPNHAGRQSPPGSPRPPAFFLPRCSQWWCLDDLPRLLLREGSTKGGRGAPVSARAVLFTFPPRSPGKPRVPTLMEAGRSLWTPHLSGSLTHCR